MAGSAGVRRAARWLVTAALVLAAAGAAANLHPDPLFAYSARHADMIGKGGRFDAAANRALLRADDPIMRDGYARRGLYRRYHLMVASMIAGTGKSVAELFADPPAEDVALAAARGDR